MTVRKYSSRSQQTTLSTGLSSSATTMIVVSGSNLMGGKTPTAGETYTVVIDPDTALEEIVDVSNYTTGNTLTITRGVDGSSAVAHSAGAVVRHMAIGRDYRESNDHINNITSAHGLTIANVVNTTDTSKVSGAMIVDGAVTSAKIADNTIVNADINTSAQIAYGKLNLTNSVTNADINASAAIDWSKIAPSATVSTTELGYLDGVTSAIQAQLDAKLPTATAASTYAPLASPALTGTPTAPTAAANTNTTQIATTAYVQTELADLVNSAPAALDTLNELAASLGNDANFATTVTNNLATKLPLAGGTMSGAIAMGTNKITGLGDPTSAQDAATKNYIDTITLAPSNLTGPITSIGNATSIASQTGTGTKFVVDQSPTIVTPTLSGNTTAGTINGTTIPSSKTLVATDSTAYVVPSQTGNSGKYLTTNGTTASWGTIVADSTPTVLMLGGM